MSAANKGRVDGGSGGRVLASPDAVVDVVVVVVVTVVVVVVVGDSVDFISTSDAAARAVAVDVEVAARMAAVSGNLAADGTLATLGAKVKASLPKMFVGAGFDFSSLPTAAAVSGSALRGGLAKALAAVVKVAVVVVIGANTAAAARR
jgi:hypothetical protein